MTGKEKGNKKKKRQRCGRYIDGIENLNLPVLLASANTDNNVKVWFTAETWNEQSSFVINSSWTNNFSAYQLFYTIAYANGLEK